MRYPLLGKETKIGGNRFYDSRMDAENASSRIGSVIIETREGYCVLEPNEGCTDASRCIIGAPRIAEKQRTGWVDI